MKYLKKYESNEIDWNDFDDEEFDDENTKIPIGLTLKEYGQYINRKVRIRKDSSFYKNRYSDDPRDMDGKIIRIGIRNAFCIYVRWDNLEENSYDPSDLEFV